MQPVYIFVIANVIGSGTGNQRQLILMNAGMNYGWSVLMNFLVGIQKQKRAPERHFTIEKRTVRDAV